MLVAEGFIPVVEGVGRIVIDTKEIVKRAIEVSWDDNEGSVTLESIMVVVVIATVLHRILGDE